jgi:hypothetical protein
MSILDEAPPTDRRGITLTRRQAILRSAVSAGALVAVSALGLSVSGRMLAAQGGSDTPPLAPAVLDRFMGFSRLATGHTALSASLGQRFYQALVAQDPQFPAKLGALVDLVARLPERHVEALETVARQQPPLHAALMLVIRAWYSGVIAEGTQATVYAYETALMYQPARDQVVIPTFAHDGPNYWVKAPPPVAVMPVF